MAILNIFQNNLRFNDDSSSLILKKNVKKVFILNFIKNLTNQTFIYRKYNNKVFLSAKTGEKGFEPLAFGFGDHCSNRWNYSPNINFYLELSLSIS